MPWGGGTNIGYGDRSGESKTGSRNRIHPEDDEWNQFWKIWTCEFVVSKICSALEVKPVRVPLAVPAV